MERKPGQWPPVTGQYQPKDYEDDLNRGTVEYDPAWKNYSFHKVTISGGTVVRDCNFSQTTPLTKAFTIVGPGKVSFVDCNLTNVAIDSLIDAKDCNTHQSWVKEPTLDGEKVQTREYLCDHPEKLGGVVPPKPADAITKRDPVPDPKDDSIGSIKLSPGKVK